MMELKRKMGKEIRIIKKDNQKKFEDSTFIDNNNIELRNISNENDSNPSSSSNEKKYKENDAFKLRNNPKKNRKASDKSRLAGGHVIQSHSPIYE
jgi:hypothetical protein